MNTSLLRLLLPALTLAVTPVFLAAADKAPAAPAAPAAAPASTALELPKMEITAQRVKKIDQQIKKLDKMIAREKNKIKPTDLDKALNNETVSKAAAIFGGNSADYMSIVAASRVMLLEQERDVLEAMKRPATLDELKMMEAQIEELRITRRNLDDASKQR